MKFTGKGWRWCSTVLLVLLCLWGCSGVEDTPQTVSPTTLPEVELTLHGQDYLTVEYGQVFEDPGAEAFAAGAEIPVRVEGTVNLQVLGEYTLTYVADYQGITKEVMRKVSVVDTTAPQITLVSDPEGYTIPGTAYEEEGYRATDAHDGDLTDRVQCRQEEDSVYYTVSDSSGNVAEVVRKIRYHDPVPPELTLEGDSAVILTAGQKWSEPGYTALDNVDGNITAQVKVSGKAIGLSFQEREDMWKRIDRRVDEMMSAGLVEEVRALLARGVPQGCTALQAIGYKEMVQAVLEDGDVLAAAEEVKLRSRQYAKRQLTWFRRNQSTRWYQWGREPDFADALRTSTEYMEEFGLV